jgi:hypothetical protein
MRKCFFLICVCLKPLPLIKSLGQLFSFIRFFIHCYLFYLSSIIYSFIHFYLFSSRSFCLDLYLYLFIHLFLSPFLSLFPRFLSLIRNIPHFHFMLLPQCISEQSVTRLCFLYRLMVAIALYHLIEEHLEVDKYFLRVHFQLLFYNLH